MRRSPMQGDQEDISLETVVVPPQAPDPHEDAEESVHRDEGRDAAVTASDDVPASVAPAPDAASPIAPSLGPPSLRASSAVVPSKVGTASNITGNEAASEFAASTIVYPGMLTSLQMWKSFLLTIAFRFHFREEHLLCCTSLCPRGCFI